MFISYLLAGVLLVGTILLFRYFEKISKFNSK